MFRQNVLIYPYFDFIGDNIRDRYRPRPYLGGKRCSSGLEWLFPKIPWRLATTGPTRWDTAAAPVPRIGFDLRSPTIQTNRQGLHGVPGRCYWYPNYRKSLNKVSLPAKFTFKSAIQIFRDWNVTSDGRSHVSSYHLKTTLLHHLEKNPPSKINSPFCLMINLLHDPPMYLKRGNLPHYFIQECNLLTTIGHAERQDALTAIKTIVSDPVATIIKCPSEPDEIYGDVCPDDLVLAFRHVSADPSCEKSREALVTLLSQLDQWRQRKYYELLKEEEYQVSGRPDLTGLADMLERIRQL